MLTAGGPGLRDASWTWHLSSPEASLTRSLALPGLTSLPVVQGHLKKYLSITIQKEILFLILKTKKQTSVQLIL